MLGGVRLRTALLVALPAVAAIAACGQSDDLTLESHTDVAGFTVTVEELGAEPRQELRLTAAPGTTQQVTMRQDVETDVDVGGVSESSRSPTTEFDITYTVSESDQDRIVVDGRYGDTRVLETPGADPLAVEAVRDSLTAFDGASFTTAFTDRGSVISIEYSGISLPGEFGAFLDQMLDSLADSAESLSMPFPVDAIGVGGVWRIESSAVLAGLPMELTSRIELLELTADRAVGAIDMDMSFVEGPTDILGTTVDIIGGDFTGNGSIEWDLAGGVTPYLETTMLGTSILEAQGQRITQDLRQHILVTPR